jgi:hypothetical protein
MLNENASRVDPFAVTDCALIALATGERAQNLRELRDRLMRNRSGDVIYYHFWGGLLRPHFVDPEYQNHFAGWAYHDLHDRTLAERLAIINPAAFDDMNNLQNAVIDVVEARMDEDPLTPAMEAEHPFFFMRSQIVVFGTHLSIDDPAELAGIIGRLSIGSLFYHFIDARRRTPSRRDDFSEWLTAKGRQYAPLVDALASVDPYFNSLLGLREQIAAIFAAHLDRRNRP